MQQKLARCNNKWTLQQDGATSCIAQNAFAHLWCENVARLLWATPLPEKDSAGFVDSKENK